MPLRHERRTPPTPRSWASLIKPAANHAPQPGQDMDSSISRPTFSAGRMATSHFDDDGLEKTYLVRPRASAATTHLATVPCVHATVLREVSNIQNSAGHGQPRRSCRPTAQLSSQGFRILLQLSRPEERRQQCRALLHSGTRVSNMHLSYSFRGDSLSLRTAPLSGGKNG